MIPKAHPGKQNDLSIETRSPQGIPNLVPRPKECLSCVEQQSALSQNSKNHIGGSTHSDRNSMLRDIPLSCPPQQIVSRKRPLICSLLRPLVSILQAHRGGLQAVNMWQRLDFSFIQRIRQKIISTGVVQGAATEPLDSQRGTYLSGLVNGNLEKKPQRMGRCVICNRACEGRLCNAISQLQ